MASNVLLLGLSLMVLLAMPVVYSQTCTSQKFTNNKVYSNCSDLPTLSSYLHWTYNSTNSSLSIAYVSQTNDSGWIAWGINPTGTGMAGAQALVAYKLNGSMTTKTLNITSYSTLTPGKLSFDVWDLTAEYSDGAMRIFAGVAVPKNATKLNQVWQVGPSVSAEGMIAKHAFAPANLNAKATLDLTEGGGNSTGSSSNDSGVESSTRNGFGFGLLLLLLGIGNFVISYY